MLFYAKLRNHVMVPWYGYKRSYPFRIYVDIIHFIII